MKLAVMILLVTAAADATVLKVGPTKTYSTLYAAVSLAQSGDTIEIDGGFVYLNDAAYIYQNNLTIRGVGATRPILRVTSIDFAAGSKATLVAVGNNLTVENIEFDGPGLSDTSANAIRLEGTTLTVRNCYIHGTETGILSNQVPDPNSEVLIENSEFADNCTSFWHTGFIHNVYVNGIKRLIFRNNWSHRCNGGHLVKSRAAETWVLYNRITDETTAADVNCPNGAYGGAYCYTGSNYEVD